MVGYGESLLKARREGWDAAYLDYKSLKQILGEVERLYDKCDHAAEETSKTSSSTRRRGEQEALLSSSDIIHEEAAVLEAGLGGGKKSYEPLNRIAIHQALEVKAHERSEAFLRALRKQVEKVSLFVLSRQGELADTVGEMRFNRFVDQEVADGLSMISRTSSDLMENLKENLTVRHDSKGNLGREYGSMHGSDSDPSFHPEMVDAPFVDDLWFLLPNITPRTGNDVNNSSLRLRESLHTAPRPLFSGKAVLKSPGITNSLRQENKDGLEPTEETETEWSSSPLMINDDNDEGATNLDPFTLVGVELLHLLRFICVNAMGVRKILKKYDKIILEHSNCALTEQSNSNDHLREELNFLAPFVSSFSKARLGPDAHLQQLTNSDSLAAITSSLLKASMKASSINVASMEKFLIHDEALLRFKCSIDCIDILREYANVVNEPFPAFLSRKAMIVTGYNLGGMEGMKQKALEVLLTFDPDTILLMDKLELAGWQQKCWHYTFTTAGNKMRSTTFDLLEQEQGGDGEAKLAWGGVDGPSMLVNMLSTLLYTVNYYIVAPTANSYAVHLGTNGAFDSTLIGASSFAAFFAAIFYSLWYNKLSFKSALIFSSLCPIFGNLMYSIALAKGSMRIALIGRVLVGFGSAEVVNRQLISSCVHFNYMTKASAGFVVAGAAGMSIGPLLAALLDHYAGRDFEVDFEIPYIGGVIFDHVSSPGFLMAALWFMQLVAVIFSFSEPFRINTHKPTKIEKKESFLSSLKTVFGLIFSTPSLPITLFLFAYIEMICEVLISSCAMVSKRYFGWTGSVAGFLIASLGALILPAHFVVERTSRSYDERAIMKYSLIFIAVSLFGILNYDTIYYDTVAGSNYVEHASVESWHTVKNVSVEDWHTVKNVSIEDWHTLRDPATWENILNVTKQDWQTFENMSSHEWTVFQNTTEHEWGKLQEEGAEEWGTLSEEAKDKYSEFTNATQEEWVELRKDASEFTNATQEEWVELRKDAKSEWSHLVNETGDDWEQVSESVSNEWKQLPNQTEEEWKKLKSDGHYEWDHIGEQTRNEWNHIEDQTRNEWNHIEDQSHNLWNSTKDQFNHTKKNIEDQSQNLWNSTEDQFNRTKNSLAQKASEMHNVTSTKWDEYSQDAAQKGDQWRNGTTEKLGEWSSEISDVLDGVTNMSASVLRTANESAKVGDTRHLNQNDHDSSRILHTHQQLPYDWNYGFYAYLIGISAIFMGTIVLEGVDTSLMCKTAPPKLNSTFINVGLLASMMGTFGRVLGDGLITMGALIPTHDAYIDFLNSVFLPLIPITLLGLYLVRRNYLALI